MKNTGSNAKPKKGRPSKAYSQAERLTRMLRALASRAMAVIDLSQEFGISRRQVYRDLDQMQEQGHPLEQSDGEGQKTWQLPLGYKGIPPITVSPYELMAMHFAKSHLDYLRGTPFTDDLDRLIAKVEAGLSYKVLNHLVRIHQVFLPRIGPLRDYAGKKTVISQLQKALLLQRTIVLIHARPDHDEPVEHQVDPYRLVLHQSGLYVVGYSHRAKAIRMFAVERMASAKVLEECFRLPDEVDLDAMYGKVFGLIDEPAQRIRIQFTSNVAYLVKERRWHPSQTVDILEDGSVVMNLLTGGMDEVASWVLSWAEDAKVLEPQALIEVVKARLARARKNYC